MRKILISACLCGHNCTYRGDNNYVDLRIIKDWIDEDRLIPVCPEVKGRLGIPRNPSEIQGDRVVMSDGRDVTEEFERGARETLEIALEEDVIFAILKENSPSCGSNAVYDGTFSGKRIPGEGVTAALLKKNGIKVYNELQIVEAYRELDQAEFDDDMYEEMLMMRF